MEVFDVAATKKEGNPFTQMKISSHLPLLGLKRSKCPGCLSSRMYFCYTCYKYVEGVDTTQLPLVKLPVKIDIVKHPKEKDGKSTAVHAAMLSPADVQIYTYPAIPDYSAEAEDVILLYPSDEAQTLSHFTSDDCSSQTNNTDDNMEKDSACHKVPSFKKVVLIDSTWNQVHGIKTDERLQGLRHVVLDTKKTNYWRAQTHCPDTYLATIEAIHLFIQQYHESFIGTYNGEYDNLLYFFKLFYEMVHQNEHKREESRKRKSSIPLK